MTREIVHRGRKIVVAVERLVDADGRTVVRDVVIHPGAVAILPVLDDQRIVLLRNHRPVVGETLWEIPAGTLEKDEEPAKAAVRELIEETGYRAAGWLKLGAFYPSPGVLSEATHLFVATQLTPGQMQLEAGEEIEPRVIEWQQALEWSRDGTIRDLKTLAALLLWHQVRTGEPAA